MVLLLALLPSNATADEAELFTCDPIVVLDAPCPFAVCPDAEQPCIVNDPGGPYDGAPGVWLSTATLTRHFTPYVPDPPDLPECHFVFESVTDVTEICVPELQFEPPTGFLQYEGTYYKDYSKYDIYKGYYVKGYTKYYY